MSSVRTATTVMAALALAVLSAFTLAAPAASAQPSGTGLVINIHYGTCLSENSTSLEVGLSACNSNHSEWWTPSGGTIINGQAAYELVNYHSNECLSEDGFFVGADTCTGNHAEYWYARRVEVGTNPDELVNVHYGLCLGASAATGPFVGTNTCPQSVNGAALWDVQGLP